MGERSYRVQPVICRGLVVSNHDRALLFFDETHEALYYAPYSKITKWSYLRGNAHPDLALHDLAKDDPVELHIPYWLLQREGVRL